MKQTLRLVGTIGVLTTCGLNAPVEAIAQEVVQGVVCHAGTIAMRDTAPMLSEVAMRGSTEQPATPPQGPVFLPSRSDPVVQDSPGPQLNVTLTLNVDGVAAPAGIDRPDAIGAVGASQYVQTAGQLWAVFNKADGAMIAGWPRETRQLWQGLSASANTCFTNPSGDVVVLYDQLADRWIFVAFPTFTETFHYCVAVSTTPDATGPYDVCAFPTRLPSDTVSSVPDYVKVGVWPDAYYTAAIPGGGTAGRACAIQRSAMLNHNGLLAGVFPRMICFKKDSANRNLPSTLMPADLEGVSPPPAGAANYYLNIDAATAIIDRWKFHVDFTTPSSSTFGDRVQVSNVASFNPPMQHCLREFPLRPTAWHPAAALDGRPAIHVPTHVSKRASRLGVARRESLRTVRDTNGRSLVRNP